jgi:tetratricopeptide (TPR) repeat protein
MWLKALPQRKAAEVGTSLADQLASSAAPNGRKSSRPNPTRHLQSFMAQVDREVVPLQLGMFRRAKLASSFKWRLLDNGFEPALADELTKLLMVRLTAKPGAPVADEERFATTATSMASPTHPGNIQALMAEAEACAARGAHDEAAECYRQALKTKPRDLLARNNLGVALLKAGDYRGAEKQFRRAVGIRSTYGDAQFNLGTVLRWTGQVAESEEPLRRAVKLDPRHLEAQVSLGMTLVVLGRLAEARECFEKVLKVAPRDASALCGLGQVAGLEGQFDAAEAMFKRAQVFDTQMPSTWVGLATLRKLTPADSAWLKGAEKIVGSGIGPADEADLRFAIGKYYDDIGNFERAFQSYERANELLKKLAPPYDREARVALVDDLVDIYTAEALGAAKTTGNDSELPVIVTGMMRSGTSLVEQIISSHPQTRGAGELPFWPDVMHKHEALVRKGVPDEPLRRKWAETYLRKVSAPVPDALRVVDKATYNSDYLGLIHLALPNARLIYVQRDPIDTCLSCYFHQFSVAHNFTLDLEDLAHYYREHRRLFEHWRAVLPAGTLLEVPYAELVADQERWSRKIVAFIGLEWDERCLDFHRTERPVLTASFWQVRQKIFKSSLGRWRHYEKFIGPLRELQDLRN